MFGDLRRAFDHLFDPEFRWLLASGVAVALVMLSVLTVIVYWGASFIQDLGLVGFAGSINQFLSSNILTTMFGLSVVLMVPIAAMQLGLFRDTVATEVERSYFPALFGLEPAEYERSSASQFRFLSTLLLGNIAVGYLYLSMPIVALLLFWLLNGFLLGREYFRQIACRRLDTVTTSILLKQNMFRVWAAGIFMSICLTLPVFNLLVPVISIASFTQMVNRLNPMANRFEQKFRSVRNPNYPAPPVMQKAAQMEEDKASLPAPIKRRAPVVASSSTVAAADPDDMTTWANIFSDLDRKP